MKMVETCSSSMIFDPDHYLYGTLKAVNEFIHAFELGYTAAFPDPPIKVLLILPSRDGSSLKEMTPNQQYSSMIGSERSGNQKISFFSMTRKLQNQMKASQFIMNQQNYQFQFLTQERNKISFSYWANSYYCLI